MESALVVVAKEPVPGLTKTRLCPPFTPAEAAEFYRCLLLDTLALMEQFDLADRVVAYTPAEALGSFRGIVPEGFGLLPQTGRHLGERLANVLAHHFELGYQRVAVMNSDGPTLPLSFLTDAFSGLDGADVTLGPGHDGGYYLIGMKRFHAELFEDILWSTEQVVPQTLAVCQRLGLEVHLLNEWYDVDVAADLDRLVADLLVRRSAASCTLRFLRRRGLVQEEGLLTGPLVGKDDPIP
jgi:rSAM/selenodomain-associated transferase 1